MTGRAGVATARLFCQAFRDTEHGLLIVPGLKNLHPGPYGDGHLGDLPNLTVEADDTATIPVLAPRLKAADVRGRALMIHAGADRYSDHGMHHRGKGGMRMYCGVIPE